MRRITILGLSFFIGACAAGVAVYGWYQSNPVVCVCENISGGTKWYGKDCPKRIKRKLRREYPDQCPSPQ
jgi:hypothetical protein